MKPEPLKDKEKCIVGGKFHGLHVFLSEDIRLAVKWVLKEIEKEINEWRESMEKGALKGDDNYVAKAFSYIKGLRKAKELIEEAFGEMG